jgi:hypothetical protein
MNEAEARARLARLRAMKDPLGVSGDDEMSESLLDLARRRYEEDSSEANMRAWLGAIAEVLEAGSRPAYLKRHGDLLRSIGRASDPGLQPWLEALIDAISVPRLPALDALLAEIEVAVGSSSASDLPSARPMRLVEGTVRYGVTPHVVDELRHEALAG